MQEARERMTREWNGLFRSAWADAAVAPLRKGAGAGYAWAMPQAIGPQPALIPGDSMFASQWHLKNATGVDINVTTVWNDYTGQGVLVGVIDDGIDYNHADLAPNYNFDADYDARGRDYDAYPSSSSDKHGTAVAGVIAAASDGVYGAVGVAPGADIAGFRMGYGSSGSIGQIVTNLQKQVGVDVSNNSWKYGGYFYDNFNTYSFTAAGQAIADAAANGRGGLGTVFVFAAGNDRTSGDDVNYHSFQNSKYVIAVAAVDSSGAISYFSDPGAAVLISAPGSSITTTDRVGSAGYNTSGDFTTLSGTSFSTPVVSGVVALMLEANPGLGYRDVQEILAYSAAKPATLGAGWQVNGADTWNGGGLPVSHDYGYGIVDALAAVRLAETWPYQHTAANMVSASASAAPGAAIADFATVTSQVVIGGAPLLVDRVDIAVNISHTYIGDLTVTLTSPSGTTSTLVNRPGNGGASQDNIVFTLESVQFWGELSNGTWTLKVSDGASTDTGILNSWTLTVFGDATTADDLYVYTDDFARYTGAGDAARRTLTDAGGDDTLNAAAVSGNTVLDLNAGGTIAGNSLTIAPGTVIEAVFFGDGNDTLVGNGADNLVLGGRGNDWLDGGAGLDTALYFNSLDHYLLTLNGDLTITVDFTGADGIDDGVDLLANFESVDFDGIVYALADLVGLVANAPPVAGDDAYAIDEDTPLVVAAGAGVLANDNDADGDPLTLSLLGGPAHGSLTLNADGSFTYTPAANYAGADSFTYEIADGHGGTDGATVNLTVNAVNDTPVAAGNAYSVAEDGSLVVAAAGVLANDSDIDGDSLSAVLVTGPAHGALVLNANGGFTYTPTENYNGADSFVYRASDGVANSNAATVNLTITPVNDAPVATADAYATAEDVPLSVAVLAGVLVNDSDIDGNPLTASLVGGPAHGSLALNADGSFVYTPAANYGGADSFTYQIADGQGGTATATVSLTVNPVDDAPVAADDGYNVTENGNLVVGAAGVLANDSDADGDALTAALVAGPAHGALAFNPDGSFSYAPDAGYSGADSFTYQASDGGLASNTATVNLAIAPVNSAPIAVADAYATDEDTPLVVAAATGLLANDSDSDGDPLSALLAAGPAHGTLALNADGGFSYTPDANYNGADSFTYRAGDGVADSADTVVSLTVNSVNDAPVAADDAATTAADTPVTIAVLANDSDTDGDTLTPSLVSGPSHGGVVLNGDNSFTYTPAAGYTGADAFVYQVSDGAGGGDTATVSLQITAPYTVITGNASANLLFGGSDDEWFLGLGGNDRIYGFGGNDLLDGGDGADQLNGGAGDDIVVGGPGVDRLYGSSGADVFRYTGFDDRGDSIRDFTRGSDRIEIHDVLTDVGYAGGDPVADGWLAQTYNSGIAGIDISVDPDGPSGAAGFAVLTSVTSIGSTPLDIGTDLIV